MSKPTPGPWHSSSNKATIGVYSASGEPVASVPRSRHVEYLNQRREADARLIAAAPDLLEAARKFLKVHDDEYDGKGISMDMLDAINALQSAVAKAEGK